MSGLEQAHCVRCKALLSPWEQRDTCACAGPLRRSNPEILYAVASSVDNPLRVSDYVRLADSQFGYDIGSGSANTTLAADRRFCWAGQGIYGLFRHGPLPGPRSLEDAARLLLTVNGAMTISAVDYCLKAIGYRYNSASLRNAIRSSAAITVRRDGLCHHPQGEAAELQLRTELAIVPPRHRAAWNTMRDHSKKRFDGFKEERDARLRDLEDPTRFGLNWSS